MNKDYKDFFNGSLKWQLHSLQSTPDAITALAGLVGLVTASQTILNIYSTIMFEFACVLKEKSPQKFKKNLIFW